MLRTRRPPEKLRRAEELLEVEGLLVCDEVQRLRRVEPLRAVLQCGEVSREVERRAIRFLDEARGDVIVLRELDRDGAIRILRCNVLLEERVDDRALGQGDAIPIPRDAVPAAIALVSASVLIAWVSTFLSARVAVRERVANVLRYE